MDGIAGPGRAELEIRFETPKTFPVSTIAIDAEDGSMSKSSEALFQE